MDKTPTVNQKRANKQPKTKKKQPLKVVYITNPIKFKASTASEFRALVQELTGQDSDISGSPRSAVADGVGGVATAAKVAVEGKIEQTGDNVGQKGSDLSTFGSYDDDDDDDDDAFYGPLMTDNFPGSADSNLWDEGAHLDVFKS